VKELIEHVKNKKADESVPILVKARAPQKETDDQDVQSDGEGDDNILVCEPDKLMQVASAMRDKNSGVSVKVSFAMKDSLDMLS
tara:strand:- start:17 stop:268 length:252 start_codon:yes stop_codon:yes gene_type:complete